LGGEHAAGRRRQSSPAWVATLDEVVRVASVRGHRRSPLASRRDWGTPAGNRPSAELLDPPPRDRRRRREIVSGEIDAFVEWFPSVVAARQKYGFKVLFAYADRQNNEFVWAVSHDGDFDAVVEEYQTSPERARLSRASQCASRRRTWRWSSPLLRRSRRAERGMRTMCRHDAIGRLD
jgi:hypothetical protein